MAFEFIHQQVQQRKVKQLVRERFCLGSGQGRFIQVSDQQYLNFSSNDYLGLSQHPKVIAGWKNAADQYGTGSGGSPLVTGYQLPHHQLEQALCEWQGKAAALLFSSGFSANQGIIKALLSKQDLLLQDKLNHASLMEAGSLSAAQFKRFTHNSTERLQTLLASRKANNCLVITEGVFSMDGDQAPLNAISRLCKQHDAWLMVDDAHGVGCLGDQGRGSIQDADLAADDIQLQMLTFGKALGVSGAAVLCDSSVRDYLINFDRSYIYSTAMPAAQAAAVTEAIAVLQTEPEFQETLHQNIRLFKNLGRDLGLPLLESDTAIQPIILGSSERALWISEQLKLRGFWVSAIRPPTVPVNTARLRVTLSSSHRADDISRLLDTLVDLLRIE
ncbi:MULTISPECIES: 8-amino-7-oxononanoate synthase [unclassified Agarivorans]|uniref:8-amino-7-oxononanoate synthase n=1 Tax=unclassified Agarivorans TaxID=2636026 RepID=UPI003D7D0D05